MPFPDREKQSMLRLKGVGEKVIQRLEQAGFSSLKELQSANIDDVTMQISQMLQLTCWRNSPQARASIQAIINLANAQKS
ncbi:helix-hairpin-helix domain-containing protein [Chlorogloeopsis sp. ULAP02]|uniref:helix-hairpin-helix domain-containing protein n=1 Tax=Chlorogloeopsis sp. ULAP02 TaxID=3107926 RepID=UPI003135D007